LISWFTAMILERAPSQSRARQQAVLVAAICFVSQDLDLLARRNDFLVGQAVRLSPPAVAGVPQAISLRH